MRVGGSSHHAGMSSLWHDPDFEPVRQFQTPLVNRNFDDLPVPTEQHELPDGVKDPFAKLDAVYDAAAVQMERGIKGAEFLHGKKPTAPPNPLVGANDPTLIKEKPTSPGRQQANELDRITRDHHRRLDQAAASTSVPKPSSSTKTAADKEVEHAANAGATDHDGALSAAMTFGPMVAAQVASSTVQGPLPGAGAVSALQTVNTVAAASEVALVGAADGTTEVKEASTSNTPRRGLSRKQ